MAIFDTPNVRRSHRGFVTVCLFLAALLAAILVPEAHLGVAFFLVGGLLVLLTALVVRLARNHRWGRWLIPPTIAVLVGVLIFNRMAHPTLFDGAPISTLWIGASYLILRLIHMLVDYKRVEGSAGDLAAYALFPAALYAGPIHRAPAFLGQLDRPHRPANREQWIDSFWRIGLGAFKKLALANGFNIFAMNMTIATNPANTRLALWFALFCYAFSLYFDFAGYSDIAIGVAGLMGITLPENFANPYAQPNITRFWQTWHMSLSFWLRDYLFFPISRSLMKLTKRRGVVLIMAIAHLTTMLLAGLWHGFNSGFVAWGLWHGTGLFLHAQWSAFEKRIGWKLPRPLAVGITFVYVCLGWTFFAFGDARIGLAYILRLFIR
jgi:D-alanyl-lipoteichoic acid acyltransferase DltB (MBOAT superfamily)